MAAACAALVLVKLDVEGPVELVLNAPVGANGVGETKDIEGQAAKEITALCLEFVVDLADGLDDTDRAQA